VFLVALKKSKKNKIIYYGDLYYRRLTWQYFGALKMQGSPAVAGIAGGFYATAYELISL